MKTLSQNDTAKLIRQVLKANFPGVTFSVRSARGSMVSAIDVAWTDGPTQASVEAKIKRFAAGSFDSMTDSFAYREPGQEVSSAGELEAVRYQVRYVDCHRRYSSNYGHFCHSLELSEAPGLPQQVAEIAARVQGQCETHESGSALISSAEWNAYDDFQDIAKSLQLQGYAAEVSREHGMYYLAIYQPCHAQAA